MGGKAADGMEKRQTTDLTHLNQQEVELLVERFVKKKGWYVPAIHEKELEKYIDLNCG
ncbi:MAG: hypothetical protein V3R82_01765 [Candidatus Hydrothermarchaeales archaeon]